MERERFIAGSGSHNVTMELTSPKVCRAGKRPKRADGVTSGPRKRALLPFGFRDKKETNVWI